MNKNAAPAEKERLRPLRPLSDPGTAPCTPIVTVTGLAVGQVIDNTDHTMPEIFERAHVLALVGGTAALPKVYARVLREHKIYSPLAPVAMDEAEQRRCQQYFEHYFRYAFPFNLQNSQGRRAYLDARRGGITVGIFMPKHGDVPVGRRGRCVDRRLLRWCRQLFLGLPRHAA